MTQVKYRYEVLFLFTLFEVLLYDSNSLMQPVIASIEYLFILFCLLCNRKVAVMYFISFTLLSMGAWSYVIQQIPPDNFWGMRVFGFSLNILFSFGMFLYLLFTSGLRLSKIKFGGDNKFFLFFIFYSSIIGAVCVLLSVNYLSNYLKDALTFLPYLIYVCLVRMLDNDSIFKIVKYGISITVVSMLVSFFTNNLFQYGDGFYFLLINSFGFIVIFAVFFFKDMYSKPHFYFLVLAVLFLFATGKLFIGSKTIIIFIMTIVWLAFRSKKALKIILFGIVAFLFFIGPIINLITSQFTSDMVVSYKFSQIFNIFDVIDIDIMASSNTSMGNIIAEAATIFSYLGSNKLILFFGKGFGGGVPDLFGYLGPMVGPGRGYDTIDLVHNDFVRMHLPIYEIILKSGLMGLICYCVLLFKSFKQKNIFSFVYFILILTVFTNTKEMLLLSLIFMRLHNGLMYRKNENENANAPSFVMNKKYILA